ncbi:MAG TPA: ABC transporter substrate-binding protein [Burkholderiales bacterium]|nr:ABC transporter substrate-binding protein [Burkholderiales bacterium]
MSKLDRLVAVASLLFLASCASGPSGGHAPASPKSAAAPPAPPSLQTVNLIVFPGGFNWPIWVAQEKGFFERQGIEVKVTPTPSSVFQLTNLIDGKFDIAMTAIDNLVAYREGQGEVPKEGPDLFAFMGGDNGFLRLVTVPEVKSYRQLKGKTLSVDAVTTGYAFVLFEILARNKMHMGKDYKVVPAGGVLQRFQALMEKKHAGTLLLSPFEVQAEEKGFHRLANATDVLGRYQGLVGGARKSWAEKNSDAVVGYIRAFSDAVDWLYNPDNREEAITIFLKNLPNATPQAALVAYGILLSPADGFQRKAKIDLEGVRTVLALRSKYAKPHKTLKDPSAYYDPSFYEAAMFK